MQSSREVAMIVSILFTSASPVLTRLLPRRLGLPLGRASSFLHVEDHPVQVRGQPAGPL